MFRSGQQRYVVILAVIAAAILAIGLVFRPKAPVSARRRTAEVTASRAELENLQRLVQRNSLRNMGTQFANIADRASEFLLPLANSDRNAVAWGGNELLLAKRMSDLPRVVLAIGADGQQYSSAPAHWVPGLPFAVARVSGAKLALPATNDAPASGAWVVAVSARSSGPALFRPGVYNGTALADCGPFIGRKALTTVLLSPEMVGGGVFDLENDLVGVIAECDGGLAVIPAGEIRRALSASGAAQILGHYGMRLADGQGPWLASGEPSTVVVTEVWTGWPAELAGLAPGDFIAAVDKQPATAAAATAALLLGASEPHDVVIHHHGRTLRLALNSSAVEVNPAIRPGAVPVEAADGIGLARITAGSSADRAGLRAGDRILQIDRQTATRTLFEQSVAPYSVTAPSLVVVQRGGLRMGVVLAP